jgi:hypothetical protein
MIFTLVAIKQMNKHCNTFYTAVRLAFARGDFRPLNRVRHCPCYYEQNIWANEYVRDRIADAPDSQAVNQWKYIQQMINEESFVRMPKACETND